MAKVVTRVDQDFIRELERREEIGAAAISHALKKSTDCSALSILDFYPELGAASECSHVNHVQGVPLLTQMPFFAKRILVKTEPFRTPELFRARYGVSVDTMVELIERHLVFPVISSDLHRYVGLDYLAPILSSEQAVVSSIRGKHFFLTLSSEYEAHVHEGLALLEPTLRPLSAEWERTYQTGAEAFVTTRAKRYARLKVMAPDLAAMVAEEPHSALTLIDMLDLVFVDPYTTAIEGTFAVDETVYRRMVEAVPLLSAPKGFEVFHSQVAQHILRYFGLTFPGDLSLSELDQFLKTDLPQQCHEILLTLNAALETDQADVEHTAKDLLEHWKETTRYLNSIMKQKRELEGLIAGGSILVVGAGAALTTGDFSAGGLAASFATAAQWLPFIARIRSSLAEGVAKLQRPKLVCIMFDFRKSVDGVLHSARNSQIFPI